MKHTWVLLVCYTGVCYSGVIIPSPDATEGDDQKLGKVGLEPRTFRDPPRVPDSYYPHENDDHEVSRDRVADDRVISESRDEVKEEFADLAAPCQLLLEPFKAELMRDKSTFLVNVDPQSSNIHLVDLNLRRTQAQVRGRMSRNIWNMTIIGVWV